MKKYIATIENLKNGNKTYTISTNESKERFIERMENCYKKPYEIPYFHIDIYELGEEIY